MFIKPSENDLRIILDVGIEFCCFVCVSECVNIKSLSSNKSNAVRTSLPIRTLLLKPEEEAEEEEALLIK